MIRLFLGLVLTSFSISASAARYDFFSSVYDVRHRSSMSSVNIKVRVLRAEKPTANVIYLHGFSDTMDNHRVLFTGFQNAGLNVVAFDYPSHGDSGGRLWAWNMLQVARILNTIYADPMVEFDRSLPVILAGWSTGAVMSLRIMQEWNWNHSSWRHSVLSKQQVIGLILFAPALPANFTVGRRWVVAELESLTHAPEGIRNSPKPSFTVAAGRFTVSLKTQSHIAASTYVSLKNDLPVLVIVGGGEDLYTTSANTVSFVRAQKKKGVAIYGFQCPGAFHGVEFEPDGIGQTSIKLATWFASTIAEKPDQRVWNVMQFNDVYAPACPRIR